MKENWIKRCGALVLTVTLLTGSAGALLGRKTPAETVEGAPLARDIEITTYRDIPYEGQFLASDSEGDDMTYAIAEEPRRGTVTIDGANFTYIPRSGASGGDRFTYTAADSGGRVSLPATVTVKIEKRRTDVVYSDTAGSGAAAAAQALAEYGIFTGVKIGEKYCFEPDRSVSRSEFLAMVLETAGCTVTEVTMTGFCDDAAIPAWAKDYAAAGVVQGLIRGRYTADGPALRGEEAITLNEAATVLDRVLNLGDVDLQVWYADREAVPSWAAQAVGNMEAFQVLQTGSFGSRTMEEPVTRGDAARMLLAVKTLLESGSSKNLPALLR